MFHRRFVDHGLREVSFFCFYSKVKISVDFSTISEVKFRKNAIFTRFIRLESGGLGISFHRRFVDHSLLLMSFFCIFSKLDISAQTGGVCAQEFDKSVILVSRKMINSLLNGLGSGEFGKLVRSNDSIPTRATGRCVGMQSELLLFKPPFA